MRTTEKQKKVCARVTRSHHSEGGEGRAQDDGTVSSTAVLCHLHVCSQKVKKKQI